MKTYLPTEAETRNKKWYIVDATDKTLGRLSSQIAKVIMGKHKPTYSDHLDMGDYVVVINAEKIKVTGNKETDKVYHWHTRYLGGLKEATFKELQAKNPAVVLEKAVKGMLPKNRLGRKMYRKLKVYSGNNVDFSAQKPEVLDIK